MVLRKLSKKVLLVVLTIIILIVVAYAVFYRSKPSQPIGTDIVSTVSVSPLVEQTIPISVTSYGQVISPISMVIKAQSDGLITSIKFMPGEVVPQGQLLFTLTTSDSGTQLKKLAAQMQLSKEIYARTQHLVKLDDGSVSTIDVLKAKLNYQQDLAQYQQAQAIYNVTSPISGVVTDTTVATGDYVSAGEVLVKVIDQKSAELSYQLPSRYAKLAHVGQSVIFTTIDNNQQYSAQVTYVAPIISDNMVSISLRAKLINASGLLTNRFGKITQALDNKSQALAVAQGLVQSDSQGFYVYLLRNNKVFKQYFTAGELTKTGFIEVISGLEVGDLLITTNPASLQEGQVVKAAN